MPVEAAPPPRAKSKLTAPGYFEPRIWLGMPFADWWKLLSRNRWQVDAKYWPIAAAISFYTMVGSSMTLLSRIFDSRRVRAAKITQPPVFILGHWRSGTTLLHELMVLNPDFAFPTTYACVAPSHFLQTEWFVRKYFTFLISKNRPMDNMRAGWEKPQEEEFALCNMGIPSPYLTIAFPNRPPQGEEYLTLEGLTPAQVDEWKQGLDVFLRMVSVASEGKRLVLKSPTHTARIKTLLEMFPDARFVHIVRDPYVVCPSTVHLWKTLYLKYGLQMPKYEGLEEYVLSTFERMYDKFDRDRPLVPAGRFAEVRYEDLVRDPVGELRTIYNSLGLDGFDKSLPRIEQYLAASDGYQTNQYELPDALREQISTRWRKFIDRHGYER